MTQNLNNIGSDGNSADVAKPVGVVPQRNNKWGARIRTGGKLKWLGTFDTVEEAAAAVADARRERDAIKQKKKAAKCKNDLAPTSIRYLRNRSFSAEQVQQMIKYDPETGEFFWGPRPLELCNSYEWFTWWHDAMVGKKIAGKRKKKRKYITIKSEKFHLHDVAWAVTYGRWPKRPIIHKNGDVKDNRIENLMEADG